MPKWLEAKLKKQYGANSDIPYKIMNKMGMMDKKHKKDMEKDMKAHHSGKGTRARLNTAAEKGFFKSKASK